MPVEPALSSCSERDASGAPLLEADETIALTQPAVALHIGDAPETSPGTLYVTTRRLVWFPDTPGAAGFAVPFVRIILHAVSRDAAACSRPCILAQVDGAAPNAQPASEEEDDREDEEDECTQLRLVPADEDALHAIFTAMCTSAALNPDVEPQDNTEGDFFYDEDEVAAGAGDDAARAAALERFDAMLSMDPGRFADEGDEEGDEEEDAFEEIQEGGDSARGHEQAKDAMQP